MAKSIKNVKDVILALKQSHYQVWQIEITFLLLSLYHLCQKIGQFISVNYNKYYAYKWQEITNSLAFHNTQYSFSSQLFQQKGAWEEIGKWVREGGKVPYWCCCCKELLYCDTLHYSCWCQFGTGKLSNVEIWPKKQRQDMK